MAETHINTNKLDYQIIAAYERREQPDGSVLYVKYREEGENTLKCARRVGVASIQSRRNTSGNLWIGSSVSIARAQTVIILRIAR